MEHQFPMLQGTDLYVIRVDSSTTRSVIVLYNDCEFCTDYKSQEDAPLLQANDALVVKNMIHLLPVSWSSEALISRSMISATYYMISNTNNPAYGT
jgi:hypothetical protein